MGVITDRGGAARVNELRKLMMQFAPDTVSNSCITCELIAAIEKGETINSMTKTICHYQLPSSINVVAPAARYEDIRLYPLERKRERDNCVCLSCHRISKDL